GNTPIRSGGSIPIENTAAPVDLSQVMDIFDPNTRAKIKTATLEGGKMLQGRGQDVNKVLSELPAISAQTADVTANLDSEQQVLDRLTTDIQSSTHDITTADLSFKETKMGKVMRHTLGSSLNISHNLSSSKGPKPL